SADQGRIRGGMMDRGMMESMGEMNCPMMRGMMQGRMADAGMSSLFGSRVVPKMSLSLDDVRGYLTTQIDQNAFPRHPTNVRFGSEADISANGMSALPPKATSSTT